MKLDCMYVAFGTETLLYGFDNIVTYLYMALRTSSIICSLVIILKYIQETMGMQIIIRCRTR